MERTMADPSPIRSRHVEAAETDVLSTFYVVPGLGQVPINAFVLRAAEPMLVDTGYLAMGEGYLKAIESVIELGDLRWIWLTHADFDHIGCLASVLERAPQARLVTTFLGLGKLGLIHPIPPQRAYLLNPGQSLSLGDRTVVAVKPPVFDAPETTGFVDTKTRTFFSSDFFGGLLAEPAETANELAPTALRDALLTWATIDAPWLPLTDAAAYGRALARVRDLAPRVVLSSHLPPAFDLSDRLLEQLASARTAPPFVGPDQEALSRMLAA
jgi:glyoxylase-like metal-dependent hydrolase (beta-lactamase superfamily II)